MALQFWRSCFKISMLLENMLDKTSECSSCLFISRRWAHFFQQVSLQGSEIIFKKKKVMKPPRKHKWLMSLKNTFIRCNLQQNATPTDLGKQNFWRILESGFFLLGTQLYTYYCECLWNSITIHWCSIFCSQDMLTAPQLHSPRY